MLDDINEQLLDGPKDKTKQVFTQELGLILRRKFDFNIVHFYNVGGKFLQGCLQAELIEGRRTEFKRQWSRLFDGLSDQLADLEQFFMVGTLTFGTANRASSWTGPTTGKPNHAAPLPDGAVPAARLAKFPMQGIEAVPDN